MDSTKNNISDEKQSLQNLDNSSMVLNIVVDKYKDIEQTLTLVKQEIINQTSANTNERNEVEQTEPNKLQLDGLNNLLTDSRVKSVIKSVAGDEANNLIDKTLGAINLSNSPKDQQVAIMEGIRELHTNFKKSNSVLEDDPTVKLAMSLVGLDKRKLSKFD